MKVAYTSILRPECDTTAFIQQNMKTSCTSSSWRSHTTQGLSDVVTHQQRRSFRKPQSSTLCLAHVSCNLSWLLLKFWLANQSRKRTQTNPFLFTLLCSRCYLCSHSSLFLPLSLSLYILYPDAHVIADGAGSSAPVTAESNYTVITMTTFPHHFCPIPFSLLLFRELGSTRALYISWEAFFYVS
jgi:hypothetical protein